MYSTVVSSRELAALVASNGGNFAGDVSYFAGPSLQVNCTLWASNASDAYFVLVLVLDECIILLVLVVPSATRLDKNMPDSSLFS